MCVRGNQECMVKSTTADINSNEPLFGPYSITANKLSKFSSSYNDRDNP